MVENLILQFHLPTGHQKFMAEKYIEISINKITIFSFFYPTTYFWFSHCLRFLGRCWLPLMSQQLLSANFTNWKSEIHPNSSVSITTNNLHTIKDHILSTLRMPKHLLTFCPTFIVTETALDNSSSPSVKDCCHASWLPILLSVLTLSIGSFLTLLSKWST